MDKEVKAIVTAAAEFSSKPRADPSELYTDVLVDA